MKLFKDCAKEMKPFEEIRDGLGLEDRIAESGVVVNKDFAGAVHARGRGEDRRCLEW